MIVKIVHYSIYKFMELVISYANIFVQVKRLCVTLTENLNILKTAASILQWSAHLNNALKEDINNFYTLKSVAG